MIRTNSAVVLITSINALPIYGKHRSRPQLCCQSFELEKDRFYMLLLVEVQLNELEEGILPAQFCLELLVVFFGVRWCMYRYYWCCIIMENGGVISLFFEDSYSSRSL